MPTTRPYLNSALKEEGTPDRLIYQPLINIDNKATQQLEFYTKKFQQF